MATTPTSPPGSLRGMRGRRWMSERQLDAYLQARDVLRRLRATDPPPADARGDTASRFSAT